MPGAKHPTHLHGRRMPQQGGFEGVAATGDTPRALAGTMSSTLSFAHVCWAHVRSGKLAHVHALGAGPRVQILHLM